MHNDQNLQLVSKDVCRLFTDDQEEQCCAEDRTWRHFALTAALRLRAARTLPVRTARDRCSQPVRAMNQNHFTLKGEKMGKLHIQLEEYIELVAYYK